MLGGAVFTDVGPDLSQALDAAGSGLVFAGSTSVGRQTVLVGRDGVFLARNNEGPFIPSPTGFAFAERDVDDLAEKLFRILRDDALADSFSRAAPIFIARNFDILLCTQRLEQLYDERLSA